MILRRFFKDDFLYIKLWKDEVEIINVNNGKRIREKSNIPFSSSRLLIADFEVAENFLKRVINKLKRANKIKRYNTILVHPMEFVEGGISEVEERIFLESFERLNGRIVKIWDGEELSNKQVLRKLK